MPHRPVNLQAVVKSIDATTQWLAQNPRTEARDALAFLNGYLGASRPELKASFDALWAQLRRNEQASRFPRPTPTSTSGAAL
jgi:hypothetical protein